MFVCSWFFSQFLWINFHGKLFKLFLWYEKGKNNSLQLCGSNYLKISTVWQNNWLGLSTNFFLFQTFDVKFRFEWHLFVFFLKIWWLFHFEVIYLNLKTIHYLEIFTNLTFESINNEACSEVQEHMGNFWTNYKNTKKTYKK